MSTGTRKSLTGCSIEELTIENVMSGSLSEDDFRTCPETLIIQAEEAEAAGYVSLGRNFRRAAELTAIPHQEVIEIYNQLRPGRTNYRRLMDLAGRLISEYKAQLTAELLKSAAEAYLKRGLIKKD